MNPRKMSQRRAKTPVILQMEATECGSTALAIIMAYYGKFVTSEEIRSVCSVSRDGTTAINIVRAARHYGMNAHGYNLDIDELNQVEVPFIVFWEFNHFLIVEGYNQQKVYLNDPAKGSRIVDWDEFEEGYTGVVLEIEPGETFIRSGQPEPGTFHLLWQRVGHNQIALLFISLITLFLILPKAAIPLFTKIFIDELLTNHQTSLILPIFLGIGTATLIEILLIWLQRQSLIRLKIKLEMINTMSFLWHLLHIPMRYFQQRSTGDIIDRQQVNEHVSATLAEDVPDALVHCIEILAYSTIILILSWPIGIIVILLIVANIIILINTKRYLINLSRRFAQEQGKLYGIEMNGLQIIETIRVGALEDHFFNRWLGHYTGLLQSEQRITWCKMLINLFPQSIGFCITLIILCLGAYLTMIGQITVGTIIALQALAGLTLGPLNQLIGFINTINEIRGDLVRLNDVMDTKIDSHFEVEDTFKSDFLQKKSDTILQIQTLSYSYSPLDPPIINELSLSVFAGQRVALVGASGSGKSTLAQLICGLFHANTGQILINNYPLAHLSRQALSQFIAYVDQNAFFFQGSLRDNLTFWNPHIPDQEIYPLLRLVNLEEEIRSRGGLEMSITEGGSNLSGGQCQRLEIVRALLRKPQLLILDEATAALDLHTESIIYQNFIALNCTLFIIAHRLHAIRNCDQILVLHNGCIAEQGTHTELMELKGIYYEQARMEKI
ncbi:hypothetical protein Lgra_1628 [Legionella gratiana]|uniref:ABC-type bacteriocin/lantibiotic exporters, contain an N-terminal double-glycine peptidase domain n=1 Tax=Legionella gratiana TaxID=45066 RepID=A0A378J759_9GAMM|nr:cysteine peptidase family C39 domain-containing protein [Legionella gratiana]KTD10662.1 hypothetical protein Lgra_1628 [Legionella gratiana]STX43644.1 ABC-type bacteriocin/lantibiotic exporters, contain an N-terminal double-glycine peptidase domain [Legionella gratiana]